MHFTDRFLPESLLLGVLLLGLSTSMSSGGSFTLTLLHTNDVHAHFQQFDGWGGDCSAEDSAAGTCYGGVARRHSVIQSIRASHDHVLLLDAGDQYQGTIWFTHYAGVATKHFMQMLGYDVMALGNHEFDNGVEGIVPFLTHLNFPVVNANLDVSDEPLMQGLVVPSVELSVSDEVIGIVGYVSKETPDLVPIAGIRNLHFTDEIAAIQAEVNKMKSRGVNKIIALGHAGYLMDQQVAAQVEGVDVVIGGHTNTFLYTGEPPSSEKPLGPYPLPVAQQGGDEAYVVQAYAFGKYLGYLNVTFDEQGKVTACAGNPILLDSTYPEDEDVKNNVTFWGEPVRELSEEEVGSTLVVPDGTCRVNECNLGNLISDSMVKNYLPKEARETGWTDVAIAIWNGGSIRASAPKGTLTLGDMFTIFPFNNGIDKVSLNGSSLRKVLEHGVSRYNPEAAPGAFLQISGMRVAYDIRRPAGERVDSVTVMCTACDVPVYETLQDDVIYKVLSSDYLIDGGDGYAVLRDEHFDRVPYGHLASDVWLEYMRKYSPLSPAVEGRISFIQTTDGDNASNSASRSPTSAFIHIVASVCIIIIHAYN